MPKPLVIVESPAKARTIAGFLGNDFNVESSVGHIRDLPSKGLSIDVDDHFTPTYEVHASKKDVIKRLKALLKDADELYLATDEDREGEAISWHLLQVLKPKVPVKRMVFHEITPSAIEHAVENWRDIDEGLVDAQETRRIVDRLFGYPVSEVLWRKVNRGLSAGRVQSVALRIIVDRELEIERFKTQEYWTVEAEVAAGGEPFTARLVKHEGKRLTKFDLGNETSAFAARDAVKAGSFKVTSVERKPGRRSPPPPFTTSTLQQEASRKLGFNAQRTMQAAQKLYEGIDIGGETVGLITYMRTDGVQTAPEALDEARAVIGGLYGKEYVPEKARIYSTKAKNAQEAHEAIRPTSLGRNPGKLRLEGDLGRLYELIWKRMIASQMEAARIEDTNINLDSADGRTGLRASGRVVTFPGYLAVYEEGKDDPEDEESGRLPQVADGAAANVRSAKADQHFTEPPPRYSEASLVKKMEELGIGRPSTYASILTVLRDRAYVRMEKQRFIPEDKGRMLSAFLEEFFGRYVEYDFTAGLEERLDLVSAGDLDWKVLLREFWEDFSKKIGEMSELRITDVLNALDEALGPHLFPPKADGTDPRGCPVCGTGRMSLKSSRFGPFLGCSNYPECRHTRPLSVAEDGESAESGDRELGKDPVTGETVWLKTGRFGVYVQLGEGEKPKRSSLPKGWSAPDMDLEKGLRLLRLPREVGKHPEDGKPILAGIGRFGPFVLHEGTYANLPTADEVFDVGVNRAVDLIATKRAGRRGGEAAALKDLGAHPVDGQPIRVLSGRYGPYIKHGSTNANVPRGADPLSVTLEQAVALIAEREAKGGGKKAKKPARAAKKADGEAKAAKKPAKKAAAKKKAPAKAKAKTAAAPIEDDETPF